MSSAELGDQFLDDDTSEQWHDIDRCGSLFNSVFVIEVKLDGQMKERNRDVIVTNWPARSLGREVVVELP